MPLLAGTQHAVIKPTLTASSCASCCTRVCSTRWNATTSSIWSSDAGSSSVQIILDTMAMTCRLGRSKVEARRERERES